MFYTDTLTAMHSSVLRMEAQGKIACAQPSTSNFVICCLYYKKPFSCMDIWKHDISGNQNGSQSFISALAITQVELSNDLACGLKQFLLV